MRFTQFSRKIVLKSSLYLYVCNRKTPQLLKNTVFDTVSKTSRHLLL